MKKQRGTGQVQGERHGAARLTEIDVALARLLAADRLQPKGWMQSMAKALRVTRSTLCMAIGGQRWRCIEDPAPVASWVRVRPKGARVA